MMLSSPIDDRSDTRRYCWRSARHAHPRVGPPDRHATPTNRSHNAQSPRSRAHAHPFFELKRPRRPPQSKLPSTHTAAKSP